MYADRCTRPDVAFAAQYDKSDFQQNPGEPHWTAHRNLELNSYCIVSETDRDTLVSDRYFFILNGGTVDWKSSKQSTTAMSTTESEYIAASEAAMEAVWIRKIISGLGIVPTINEPLNMYCDNSAAVHYLMKLGVQKGAMTLSKRYHMIAECVELANKDT
ncbi:hypothetical protein Tco_1514376 [Tanacetum coccineum]